jgi:thioredoxin reductase
VETAPRERRDHEYLVLGAGPAGVQAGYYLERAGRDYRILEAGESPGTFFKTFPRHRRLISVNKRHTGYDDREVNLRWDWNSLLAEEGAGEPRFTDYSDRYFPPADRLVDYLGDFARRHTLRVEPGARAQRVSRAGAGFRVEDEAGRSWSARRLIVATGMSRPHLPPIPGIELADSYSDAPKDAAAYTGEHVLIVGKGNSGFETAEPLIETAAVIHVVSPESLRMAWQTHHVGHLRALNNDFLDTYQLKCQNAVLDATVERIRRRADGRLAVTMAYSHAGGEREELVYDRVICCTGFRFDAAIFDASCRPELALEGRFPAQTSEWESPNVPDLFFAGTLMQTRDYKRAASSFIHGFRYNVRTLHRLLERRYHGRELPSRPVPATPEALAEAVLARCNRSSGLWQQFGFLADAVVVPEAGSEGRYFEELPMDWLRERDLAGGGACFAVTLEFGPSRPDPFRIERAPEPARAEEGHFLHPVVRRLEGGREVARVHLLENLYGEWHDERLHREPLVRFFEAEVGAGEGAARAAVRAMAG